MNRGCVSSHTSGMTTGLHSHQKKNSPQRSRVQCKHITPP